MTRAEIESLLSFYGLDGLEKIEERPGDESRAYRLELGDGMFVLRLSRCSVDDMIFERDLLCHLQGSELGPPVLVRNKAGSAFTPWGRGGRHVSLFRLSPGRSLARFELRPDHVRSIGRWLAQFHARAAEWGGVRKTPSTWTDLDDQLHRLERAIERRRLARRHLSRLLDLRWAFERLGAPDHRGLPYGIIHGSPALSTARFVRGALRGLTQFQHARSAPLVLDLAYAARDLCWVPAQMSLRGPQGVFHPALVRALLDGYGEQRTLSAEEVRGMETELRRMCLEGAIRDLIRFELQSSGAGFRDYRHDVAKLWARWSGQRAEDERTREPVRKPM